MRHSILAALILIPISAERTPVLAHDHQTRDGTVITWYDNHCCNNKDCAPVVSMTPAAGGFVMRNEHGATALVTDDAKRLPSKDMRWHTCVNSLNALLCVYEPPSVRVKQHFAQTPHH